LNESQIFESFEEIQLEGNEPRSVLTIFREEKRNRPMFQPISEDTMIVFVKLYEPAFGGDLTFLGHVLARRPMPCLALLEKIVRDLTNFHVDVFNAYVEEKEFRIREISCSMEKLAEFPLRSGSSIILRKKQKRNEVVWKHVVQQELFGFYKAKLGKKFEDPDVEEIDPSTSQGSEGSSRDSQAGFRS